ncbi:MAG: bifunctional alpha/beta hydrolase/OsmC family protein [Bacteroidota bacterium]|nr:bifunctional alpha/beta hydrolase/OsmC family protein [Bacteroidota bacterium]
MKRKTIHFTNRHGLTLAARLQTPIGRKPRYFALFAHCFTCSKNFSAIKNISDSLANQGVGVMAFDFTGLGNSEGDFSKTDFSSNINDLIDAAGWLEDDYEAPKLLIGHSLGGAAVLFAAAELPETCALVTIGAPAEPEHVTRLLKDDLSTIEKEGKARVNIGGRDFTIRREFLEDLKKRKLEDLIGDLRIPLLIAHSPQDNVVGIKNAAKLYVAAHHPKSFISLDGADHLLTDEQDSLYLAGVISSWATRYIPGREKEPTEEEVQTVRVSLDAEDDFTTPIETAGHRWMADEPKDVGGRDLGPNPYQLLLSALGACTAMTLQMYARRKKWDLKEVNVSLGHSKRHLEDCMECDKSDSKIDLVERKLELEGDLSEEQQKKLLVIANRCPVHKTMENGVDIQTELSIKKSEKE